MSHVGDPQALLPLMEGQLEGIVQDRALGIEDGFEFIPQDRLESSGPGRGMQRRRPSFAGSRRFTPTAKRSGRCSCISTALRKKPPPRRPPWSRAGVRSRDPQALLDEGTARLTNGDFEGAFELLQRAAPEFPALEAAWYNLGMVSYRAWKNGSRRKRPSPGPTGSTRPAPESFFFRGIALQQLSRCSDAVQDLEKALALDPQRTDTHYYLATCYKALGNGRRREPAPGRLQGRPGGGLKPEGCQGENRRLATLHRFTPWSSFTESSHVLVPGSIISDQKSNRFRGTPGPGAVGAGKLLGALPGLPDRLNPLPGQLDFLPMKEEPGPSVEDIRQKALHKRGGRVRRPDERGSG